MGSIAVVAIVVRQLSQRGSGPTRPNAYASMRRLRHLRE